MDIGCVAVWWGNAEQAEGLVFETTEQCPGPWKDGFRKKRGDGITIWGMDKGGTPQIRIQALESKEMLQATLN